MAEQPVGVLVAATLPGAARVAEVHLDTGVDGELQMFGRLPVVPGEGAAQLLGPPRHRRRERPCCLLPLRRSRQPRPEPVLPAGPEAKTTKNRVYLDLNAGGAHGTPLAERRRRIDAEVERLLGAGATRLGTLEGAGGYVVNMADPEGNEFDVR